MSGRISGFLFLGVCVILAILLIFSVIGPILSGSIFAIALVLLGGISRGFRIESKKNPPS